MLAWAVDIGEVPMELEWLCQVADDWDALFWQFIRIGVLVAHHDECLTIDRHFVVQLAVAGFQIVKPAIECM